ncbi:MAG: helix-turn-helix domain-containing protein [Chloroflexi bacterium]|nr:helix-turn-helix domain-containing protein [Chloroflexota bacterium]
MRIEGCEAGLLRALAAMPFLNRLEMVDVTGWSRGAVYEAVERLETGGLCASVLHATELQPRTQRFHLTAEGLRRLACEEGMSLGELLRERPVSAQWRRSLMERLDALASVYRIASTVSRLAFPMRFRWYRAAPLDAAMALPGGRTVGIVRQGATADRSGFAKRLWRLRAGPVPGLVLILMADDVRLRHARRALSTTEVPALFALEREAAPADPGDRIWSPSRVSASIDLRDALDRAAPGGGLPQETEPERADVPADLAFHGRGWESSDQMLPFLLKPAEKRALDLIADWPWVSLRALAGLMGVSPQRVSQSVNPLEGFGLVARPHGAGCRLAPTDRGLALLARRDRTSVAMAKRRWSIALGDAKAPFEWRNVTGGRSRQLLRNIEHTEAVHGFLAALTTQAPLLGWEVVQLDPPRRASRHFRHDGGMRSVNPDAFGILRKDDARWPFFLEWERRAVRPSTMSDRLAPYLRYYSSQRPIDDHGARPAVLIVFDDEIAHTHFLRVAREEMRAEQLALPLWVSHRAAVDALGPLGHAWRSPSDWEAPQAMPPR